MRMRAASSGTTDSVTVTGSTQQGNIHAQHTPKPPPRRQLAGCHGYPRTLPALQLKHAGDAQACKESVGGTLSKLKTDSCWLKSIARTVTMKLRLPMKSERDGSYSAGMPPPAVASAIAPGAGRLRGALARSTRIWLSSTCVQDRVAAQALQACSRRYVHIHCSALEH